MPRKTSPPPTPPAADPDPRELQITQHRPDAVIVVRPGDKLVFVWPRADPAQLAQVKAYFDERTAGWGVEAIHMANAKVLHIPADTEEAAT